MDPFYLVGFATFLTQVCTIDVDIEGEVSFQVRVPKDKYKVRSLSLPNHIINVSEGNNLLMKVDNPHSDLNHPLVTVGPRVECPYQYPEGKQVQILLSNMMNELTKVFVRAFDLMKEDYRRRGGTRFVIVANKNTSFFENIYSNMTKDYLQFYNSTTERVDRAEKNKDPCEHQEEVKQLWKDLLDKSLVMFRRGSLQCIEEHLRAQNRSTDEKTRYKLSQFLMRELKNVRMHQLVLLCDKYQLCFNELAT